MNKMDIIDKVKEIPIEDIINLRIKPVIGRQYLCPFHDDHTPKNFHINTNKNFFKCFACDCGGDGIKFISEYDGISRDAALEYLAKHFGIIKGEAEAQVFRPRKIQEKKVPKKVNPQLVNDVYEIFSSINEIMGKSRLTNEHYRRLKEDRFLTDTEINTGGYFTFPNLRCLRVLIAALEEYAEEYEKDLDILEGIAGFYFDTMRDKWTFVALKNNTGIGIPIKNKDGLIVGIQIRLDKDSKAGKYIWFSSAFATSGDFIKGSSVKSSVAVFYPEEKKYDSVFITEGYFKASALSKQFNSIALSVQGVNNWIDIPEIISEKSPDIVYVAFDADMARKESVIIPLLKMCIGLGKFKYSEDIERQLYFWMKLGNKNKADLMQYHKQAVIDFMRETLEQYSKLPFKIKILLWDEAYGKGADDLINNGHAEMFKALDWRFFLPGLLSYLYDLDKLREKVVAKSGVRVRQATISEDDRNEYFNNRILSSVL